MYIASIYYAQYIADLKYVNELALLYWNNPTSLCVYSSRAGSSQQTKV